MNIFTQRKLTINQNSGKSDETSLYPLMNTIFNTLILRWAIKDNRLLQQTENILTVIDDDQIKYINFKSLIFEF